MPARNPSPAEVLNALRAGILADVRVALPARVESYDAATQLADVQPLVKEAITEEDGTVSPVRLPMITNVPIVFPGGGGFRATFPIAPGDTVLLVFADRSIDAWLAHGGESTPVDLRRHNLSDAIAIPGLHPNPSPWTGASTTAATFGKDGGPQVLTDATQVQLGGADAAQPALKGDAYAEAVSTYLAAILSALGTLGSGLGTSPVTGAALAAAITGIGTASTPSYSTSVAAAKSTIVKVK